MSAAGLLDRLVNVKQTGPGRWLAKCPAHDDRKPSLSIRETSDGTILLKCWAGCGAADVVGALGLTLADLFFHDEKYEHKAESRPFPAGDILKGLATESVIVLMAAESVAEGKPLVPEDQDRLLLAISRIRQGVAYGRI